MYQCPNCGGRLIFDISSQSMLCEHCNTHYNPYNLGEGNSAEESKEYDVTVFKCPQCGGEIMSTDNTIADFAASVEQLQCWKAEFPKNSVRDILFRSAKPSRIVRINIRR